MKIFLSSLFAIIFATSIYGNVEDARKLAEEQIFVLELHMYYCEEEGYNNDLVMDYQYHSGYVHGARDAYENMLKKIKQN